MATEEVGMTYTQAAVERAMKVYEVLVQALKERQPWIHVAEVLGVSARTVRRLRWRYEHDGFEGLFDHRRRTPSPRCAPVAEGEPVESADVIMAALRAVLETHGIPGALYTDRAGWAVYTPTSGSAPDRSKLTQVGRALAKLGIEHIVGFSPQARGRSERANGTLQGRLVNELRVAEIRTMAAANQYLRERFLPDYNATFGRAPADPTSAFVPIGRVDLDQILCHEEERVVARDSTVRLDGVVLQIDKQRGRRSCATLRVVVRRHLTGQHSVWWGPRCLGRYTAQGRPLAPPFGSTAIAAPGGI